MQPGSSEADLGDSGDGDRPYADGRGGRAKGSKARRPDGYITNRASYTGDPGDVHTMPKRLGPENLASKLTVPERVLLFCLASGTDWVRAGVNPSVAQHMLVRDLVARDQTGNRFVLTALGRAVLAALLRSPMKAARS